MKTKKLTLLALLSAIALTIFMIEAQIPSPVPIPGVKLGLANIVTVFTVFVLGPKEGAAVLAVRVFLGAVFAGNFSTILYSAAGGVCAIGVTIALRKILTKKQLWVAGCLGAVAHSVGQMAHGDCPDGDGVAGGLPAGDDRHQHPHRAVHRALRPISGQSGETMENYFKMNLPQSEIDAISNLGLAHMGDCVFEILCRGYLCAQGEKTVGQLHHDTIQMVKATSQAKFVDKLLPLLTEEELAYYRRGKNAHVHAVPKSATPAEYAKATGLESLFGALYLAGKTQRLNELFKAVMGE